MRATRAYIAGFGTSGSLLAGAALMFLFASAFVAFRGWPSVADQGSPVPVSVPQLQGSGSPAYRSLLAAAGLRPPVAGTSFVSRGARTAAGHAGVRHATGGTRLNGVLDAHGRSSAPSTAGPHPTPDPGPGACSTGCTHPINNGDPIRNTVTGATETAGNAVNNTVTTVKKLLPSGTAGSAGSAVSKTGSTVTHAVGGTVKTVTGAVGSATSGLP